MLTTRSRSFAAIAAGSLLVAALAGCGGSDDKSKDASAKTTTSASPSPSASESATADATTDSGDAGAAAPGERLTKDNLVATMVAAMRDKKTAHMTLEIGSSVGADADLRYSDTATDMKMSMDMGSTKATVIVVDGVLYMQQAPGAKFQKIDKSDPTLGSLVDQLSAIGPQSSIEAMKGAVQKVEYAGTKTIDGTKTNLYHVTVDTQAAAKTLGGIGAAAGNLPKAVTYDLYVDDDHLMRRVDMTVSKQRIVMNVSDWGKPVDIEAPPASQVITK